MSESPIGMIREQLSVPRKGLTTACDTHRAIQGKKVISHDAQQYVVGTRGIYFRANGIILAVERAFLG